MTRAEKILAHSAGALRWCEELIRVNSHSFYMAFKALPAPKRASVFAVYAFCRLADDAVDEAQSEKELARLEQGLGRFFKGDVPDGPMWQAMQAAFALYDLRPGPFYDMLKGQRQDLRFKQPASLQALEGYCYYVAGSVGAMILPILCTDKARRAAVEQEAEALGTAMQLTNILRDVGEDLNRGRIYLPAGQMAEKMVTERQLREGIVTGDFIELWEQLAARAGRLYQGLEQHIGLLDADSRLPTLAALYMYRAILDSVRANGYDCFTQRAFVPDAEKLRLAQQAKEALAAQPVPLAGAAGNGVDEWAL